jgi:hypothetical protein
MPRVAGPVLRAAALVALVVCAAPGRVAGQELWYKVYQDGVAAFDKHDYVVAEQKLRASMEHPKAPQAHGPNVLLYGQLRGFEPERYLARIYFEQKKFTEAAKYLAIAEMYPGLNAADRRQLAALRTSVDAGGTADVHRASEAILASARAALENGDLAGARAFVDQAAAGGAAPDAVAGLRHDITAREFDGLLRQAGRAVDEKRYDQARELQTRARALNVDAARNSQADALAANITTRQQFDGALADARRALDTRQWPQAKTAADRAVALMPADANAKAIADTAARHITFDTLLATAQRAFDSGQLGNARQAVSQAAALNVDSAALEPLTRTLDVRETSDRIRALLQSRSYAGLGPLLDKLGTLDPRNPLIAAAQREQAATLGNSQRERLALSEFYRGRYDAAVAALSQITGGGSPRTRFYLACSKAALALIEPDAARRQSLEAEALAAIDPVRVQLQSLELDRRYVSPRILVVLKLTAK